MKIKSILCALVMGFAVFGTVWAKNIPQELLATVREHPEVIEKQVNSLDVRMLVKDSFFIKTLTKELKNKNTTAEEKVYYFYLMLDRINWAFCGGIGFPVSHTYEQECIFQIMTINKYRDKLCRTGIDSQQFFDLTFQNIEEKPILAAYSFLLGSLVADDIDKSLSVCKDAYLNQKVFEEPTWYRSMLIHNMMLLSQPIMNSPYDKENFTYHPFTVICQSILDECDCKEEEKEDLIICHLFVGGTDSDSAFNNFGRILTHNIIAETDSAKDQFILTCCCAAKSRLGDDEFMEFIDMMVDYFGSKEEDAWKKNLIESCVKNNNYEIDYVPGMRGQTGTYQKSWDDISMTAYDDGILFHNDDYAVFHPYNNK